MMNNEIVLGLIEVAKWLLQGTKWLGITAIVFATIALIILAAAYIIQNRSLRRSI
ncbi:MAG: hypothetical protein RR620_13115 [Clostridium sp.]